MGGGRSSSPNSPSSSSSEFPDFVQVSACGGGDMSDYSPSFDSKCFPLHVDKEGDSAEGCTDVPCMEHLLPMPVRSLHDAKELIQRYKPGLWIQEVGGTTTTDYAIPETTTLLLVGLKGAGKSMLVNWIIRVFDDDVFAPDMAQISNTSLLVAGSSFLQEYMILRDSKSVCVYDSPGLSLVPEENFDKLRKWMQDGVRHRELVVWPSDGPADFEYTSCLISDHCIFSPCKTRNVNFVIFVVNGLLVFDAISSERTDYLDLILKNFSCPFLTLQDDKPVVVVTHGDRLSPLACDLVSAKLEELLGIPTKQVFTIPGRDVNSTNIAILDMLRYCLVHADKNLPYKERSLKDVLWRGDWLLSGAEMASEVAIFCICIALIWLQLSL